MKEILFRGKRVDNGEWVYGHYGEYTNMSGEAISAMSVPDKGSFYGNTCYDVGPSTVGQYTGLTDKNGKKIFEGDVLRVKQFKNETEYMCKVVFNPRTGGFEMWNDVVVGAYGGKATHQRTFANTSNYTVFEIIGNIYDNPELLEVGE